MANASPPLTTPFDDHSTAEEVLTDVDLSGRRAIVTGASSGIGKETARVLALRGAAVTMTARDLAAGETAAAEIRQSTGNRAVDVRRLELADPSSVVAFVDRWDGPLDILVNNAGVMAIPERSLTPSGHELHFATNHLGHFALATGLASALRASGDARIVSVSSSANLRCPVLFDDLTFAFVAYDPFAAYGQSKTANVLFAVEADRRWARDGIRANALMPGGIATNLQRHIDPEALAEARRQAGASTDLKTIAQGAATSVLAAASPLLRGVGGRYLEDNREARTIASRADSDGRHGVAPYALDPDNAQRLWDTSERLLAAHRP
ncbi:MAG TPA: SDR family NAD(P)-dependent oxidoreductase [Solirubrobacteraceae bacterium]|nr:SDR family NAD(P)-dependent oxidoreductase [Solirubrobacteraceae bacterium]